MSIANRTFYCPTCGDAISLMLGRSGICKRCGRQVPPPPGFQTTPAVTASFAQPSALAPRPKGTPGIVVELLLYFTGMSEAGTL